MSSKPSGLRERRLNSSENMVKKPQISSRSNIQVAKPVLKDLSSGSIRRSKIPVLHLKNLSSAEGGVTSRRKLKILHSTRAIRQLNLSMYSPSNTILKSSRIIHGENSLPPRPQFPMPPNQAVDIYKESISEFELIEIFDYSEIYFYPLATRKFNAEYDKNHGFDNDKGDYGVVIGDHIEYRYEILTFLGKGSFGQVCKCFDHKNKELVAIKVIKNKKRYYKQGMIEVKILEDLKANDPLDRHNIVKIYRHFVFRGHLWIVFEILSLSLFEFIKINGFQRIKTSLVAKFAVQLLTGLQFSASLGIIHCDLKPENILLKNPQKSGIKIIDFGSGCYDSQRVYTYIQSRFYRAPEIMLGIPYTCSIDMWSLACVLAEIHLGYPIFPGENEQEQFLRIVEVLGPPGDELLAVSQRKRIFFDSLGKVRIVPNSRGKVRYPGTRSLQDILRTDDLMFLQFLTDILMWNPKDRPTPNEALNHQWLVNCFNRQPSPVKKRVTGRGFTIKEV